MKHKKISTELLAFMTEMKLITEMQSTEIVRKLNYVYSLKPKSMAKRLYQLYFYGRFLSRKEERDCKYITTMAKIVKIIKDTNAQHGIILSETESLIKMFDPTHMFFELGIVNILREIDISIAWFDSDTIHIEPAIVHDDNGDISRIRALLKAVHSCIWNQQVFLSYKHLAAIKDKYGNRSIINHI